MTPYTPTNWYWIVAGSTSQVFSSASGTYVANTDATYQAWLSAGNRPTSIVSEAELIDVLATAAPNVVVGSPAGLVGYALKKQGAIAAGGISVNVGTQGAPQMVEVETDADGKTFLLGAYTLAQANANYSTPWVQSNGQVVQLSAAQIITMWNAVTAFLDSTFITLAGLIGGISASPATVTSKGQVDAPPSPIAAWPANS